MVTVEKPERTSNGERGQMIVLFALSLTAIVLAVGVVIDGGNALVQRRASQNASDFAALAGARIVAEWISGDTTNGTDANVKAAITASIAVNRGSPVTFGTTGSPVYVDSTGSVINCNVPSNCVGHGNGTPVYVGNGVIPTSAVGVQLTSSRSWTPYFLGLAGISTWSASATATAKGGYAAGGPGTGVFPAGIAEAFFANGRTPCSGPVNLIDPTDPCYPAKMTPGTLNVPGGFGWLKFGCTGYGLGQVPPASNGGCDNSKPFLQTEIGHPGGAATPPGDSFGCCTQVGLVGSLDDSGSLPGNKVSADCSWYINNDVVVTVPVWDTASGTGQNASYHIIGFTGFQITACDGGKDIVGVWRVPFFLGPTTTTPGFAGAPLAVQLVQ